eukprot:gene12401-biopygen4791
MWGRDDSDHAVSATV